MRLTDYVMSSPEMKKLFFDTVIMRVGLRYYGGKSISGKYILNRIFEMQAYRYVHKEPAKVFIDAFAGGGKIALSIPTGWFDTIVINDLNFGVYSFYMCCQNAPLQLIEMIDKMGSIMCKAYFQYCARTRSNVNQSLSMDETPQNNTMVDEGVITPNMLLAAAKTFWVTQSSWLGETDPEKAEYALSGKDKNEHEEIEKRRKLARKRIIQINQKMARQKYIIENMDYAKLIIKYKEKYKEEIIWYFDPPYHEATLNKSYMQNGERDDSQPAPYEDTFSYSQTMVMTYALATMKWFIKSDYDPSLFFSDAIEEESISFENAEVINDYYHDFDLIENIDKGFVRENLGSFKKNSVNGEGYEVIWSRYDGSMESVMWMQGVDKEEDIQRKFWDTKCWYRDRKETIISKLKNILSKAKMTDTDKSEDTIADMKQIFQTEKKEYEAQHPRP